MTKKTTKVKTKTVKAKPKTKVVTIKRSKWAVPPNINKFNKALAAKRDTTISGLRADDIAAEAALYDSASQMMCCLGFVCSSGLGIDLKKIKDVGMPTDAKCNIPHWLANVESEAARINDDEKLGQSVRETKLRALFAAKTPIRLRFVP